jgi:hypothetical protein
MTTRLGDVLAIMFLATVAACSEQRPTYPESSPVASYRTTPEGYVAADAGCHDPGSSDALGAMFADRIGPSIGMDGAHVYRLGDRDYLWIFQDAFLDYSGEATTTKTATYVHNLAMRQRGDCFEIVHQGTPDAPGPFEPGDGADQTATFFWPLGGGLGDDGLLYVFWSQMQQDAPVNRLEGVDRHPIATWLGSYQPDTLARVAFTPAPNADVTPQYGSAVENDASYTYLFGNTNVLNLAREGGAGHTPYSGTREYLARVGKGRFLDPPEYFAGSSWSPDPTAATPISERFDQSNAMQPRLIDDTWLSVTKADEFWGANLVVDQAPDAPGPWSTVADVPATAHPPPDVDPATLVTYQPTLLPWRSDDDQLMIVVSQNSGDENESAQDPRRYRPFVVTVAWPG